VEAFVPGFGWIGLDPTHGTMATEEYVTVAVGRSYVDVPPNRGVYRGKASEKIRATVTMQPIEERARLTPYSTALERPRKRTSAVPASLPLESRFGLEHQQIHPDAAGFVVQQQRQQQQ
jgi:transglutaminase-like putative cysteine protease